MLIHLLRAPDYLPKNYFAVCDLLCALNLPGWKFIVPEIEINPKDVRINWGGVRRQPEDVQFDYHSPVAKIMYNRSLDVHVPLFWSELFDICLLYRRLRNVKTTSIVVLLTNRTNALNWFSAFDKEKNVFIHTADWDKFIPCEPTYPVTYHILSNALQLSIVQNLKLSNKEECMHQDTIGCMNNFCVHKGQIALKLRTGDICSDCLYQLKVAKVPDVIVDAALHGFDQLRRQMLFRQGFKRSVRPNSCQSIEPHSFPDQGNLEEKMPWMVRTVYLFFLKHIDGIRLAELSDYKAELFAIYAQVNGAGDQETMHQRIDRLVDPVENTLYENLSRIRRALIDTLGMPLAAPYLISGEAGERYRLQLDPDLIRYNG